MASRIRLFRWITTGMLMVAIAWWWLPQKWSVCQKLYDNKPAQIFCLLASK